MSPRSKKNKHVFLHFFRSQNQGGATAVSTPKPSEPFNTHSEDKASDDRKVAISWNFFPLLLFWLYHLLGLDFCLQVLSSIYLLKGQILEALDNRCLAAEAYQEAVRVDVYCHEAFKSLVKHNILSGNYHLFINDNTLLVKAHHTID